MNSQSFADEKFGGKKVGQVDKRKLNTKQGSLALGNEVGYRHHGDCRLKTKGLHSSRGLGHACNPKRYDI